MRSASLAIGVAALFACLALNADERDTGDSRLYLTDKVERNDVPLSLPNGAKVAVLEGDPNKEGPCVFRVKAPDGYRIPPHTHPKTERITVISGTFNIDMGDKFEAQRAKPMPAETYGCWESGIKHFV